MRSFAAWLLVAIIFLPATLTPAFAQNGVSRTQVDALLNAYEGVAPEQWRGLGNAAAPVLESIAVDQGVLPTRRARALDGLSALGSGEATMRRLANSSTAPLIVRMAAVRGLGRILPEASLIDALRPLLHDAEWQVRGIAAETLSSTAAGCATISDMAKRETEAWRSRFVRLCTQPASSVPTPMAPDALAGDPTSKIVMYKIKDPAATVIYQYPSTGAKIQAPSGLGAFAVLMPNAPAISLSSGSWQFYPLGSKATVADFQGMIKTPLSAGLNSGTLNANLFFVGVPGLTAATAPSNAVFQSVLSKVNTIYAQVGLQLGTVTYIDITGADATTYTDVDPSEFDALMKLSANPQAPDGAINLFFVHSISGGAPGFIILGESAGIPGVPVRGTSGSGVAVMMADFPNGLDDLAQTIAHEGGHWLGLFHTTESAGTAFDPLADTPQCPKVPNDTDNNGLVDPVECAALDGPNLMFWTSASGPQPSLLTSNQKFVQLRNPTVNVPNTQVDVVSYGQLTVPTASLTTVITAAVPADAASLTVVGVVTESPVTVPDRLRYVNAATATGAHDGTSWTDAYSDLAAALAAEPAGTKFWVAHGIYKPTAAADRSAAFTVKSDMAIYGGFAGTETLLGQRNPAANPTVLSADIDNNDTSVNGIDADASKIVGNNSYHVVVLDGTTGTISSSTILDGLTITGGKADGASAQQDRGGGVLCNTTCDATLSNLYFAGNNAAYVGGALYHEGASSPIVTNTTFAGNAAANGGAVYQIVGPGTAPVFANVTFAGNSVSDYGGAMYTYQTNGSASLAMTNVTFAANQAGIGGAAMAHYNCGATLTSALTNTIIWGNSPDSVVFVCDTPTFKNSVVQGSGGSAAWNALYGIDGGGNLAADPLLRPLTNNGGSTPTVLPSFAGSAIEAGLDSACVAAPVNGVDQRGIARPFGPHCDIGAAEVKTLVITSAADPGDGICDGTCTLRDAITTTQSAGASVHDVVFDASFNTPKTVNLTAALPTITKDITINGPGANLLTVRRDTGGDYRIFSVNSSANASLSGLTIANGKNGFGGGISNAGRLTIDRCTLTGNVGTTNGGAIQNSGALVVTNSTISGNSSAHGGGVYNFALNGAACALGCSASLINTTISGNTASSYAGGVMDINFGGVQPTVTLVNSTVAANSEPGVLAFDNGGPATITLQNTIVTNNQTQDLADSGTNPHVISLGHNLTGGDGGGYFTQPGDLINTNPRLTSLGNYGGTTQTLYLNPGSPAIDAGDDAAAADTDQRGVLRPVGAHVDIGAVEVDGTVIFQNGFD